MQQVPVSWDETKFIDGYPGKFYAVARRSGSKWYVAAMNADSTEKQIVINNLPFIKPFKTGTLFFTDPVTNDIAVDKLTVYANQLKSITIKPNHGFVLVIE